MSEIDLKIRIENLENDVVELKSCFVKTIQTMALQEVELLNLLLEGSLSPQQRSECNKRIEFLNGFLVGCEAKEFKNLDLDKLVE